MSGVFQVRAVSKEGHLEPDGLAFKDMFDRVMSEGCAVLRDAFPKEPLRNLVRSVHDWGQNEAISPAQTYIDKNFHAIEAGISPRQKTPHIYHAYNFLRMNEAPPELSLVLYPIFERIRIFQNHLTGNEAEFKPDSQGRKARPQIIHYPSGGGMFGRHIHPLEPQKIGLILGLSERGVDFQSGATHFEAGGVRIATDDCHNIGDLIMFRFDIPHWITCIDQGDKFDSGSPRGRWTAVLPFA
jgi:hypothetical protein